jgi:hypothetical protein
MKKSKQIKTVLGGKKYLVISKEDQAKLQESFKDVGVLIGDSTTYLTKAIEQMIDRVNESEYEAFLILSDAIEDALATQELKNSMIAAKVAKKFLELLNSHPGIPEHLESVFDPVTKQAIKANTTEVHKRAGSALKKPEGYAKALLSWQEWVKDPTKFKNKTAWISHITSGDQKFCNSNTTANAWLKQFQKKTSEGLEKKLDKS